MEAKCNYGMLAIKYYFEDEVAIKYSHEGEVMKVGPRRKKGMKDQEGGRTDHTTPHQMQASISSVNPTRFSP